MKVTTKQKILLFLGNHKVAHVTSIAKAIGHNKEWVAHALLELMSRGKVKRFKAEHPTVKGRQIYYYSLAKQGKKTVEYLRNKGMS